MFLCCPCLQRSLLQFGLFQRRFKRICSNSDSERDPPFALITTWASWDHVEIYKCCWNVQYFTINRWFILSFWCPGGQKIIWWFSRFLIVLAACATLHNFVITLGKPVRSWCTTKELLVPRNNSFTPRFSLKQSTQIKLVSFSIAARGQLREPYRSAHEIITIFSFCFFLLRLQTLQRTEFSRRRVTTDIPRQLLMLWTDERLNLKFVVTEWTAIWIVSGYTEFYTLGYAQSLPDCRTPDDDNSHNCQLICFGHLLTSHKCSHVHETPPFCCIAEPITRILVARHRRR